MNFANKNGFSAASTNEGVSAANADWLLFLFFGIPRLMGYYFQDCQQGTLQNPLDFLHIHDFLQNSKLCSL